MRSSGWCRRWVISIGIGAAALAGGDLAASCSGFLNESFWGNSYVVSPGRNTPDSIDGVFWALGFGDPAAGSGNDNGAWGDTELTPDGMPGWLLASPPNGSYLNGYWTSSPQIDGCILGRIAPFKTSEIMVVAFSDDDEVDPDGFFAVAAVQRQGTPDNYNFTFGSDSIDLVQIPKPLILGSSRIDATTIQLDVRGPTLAEVTAGVITDGSVSPAELVTGFRLFYQHTGPGPAPFDRRRDSGWIPITPPTPLGQTARFTIDCSCFNTYLAASLVFESGFETAYVSRNSTRIDCRACDPVADFDLDGYLSNPCCTTAVDCDDSDPAVHPNALEVCNGHDDDCDGQVDDDPAGVDADADGDGVAAACDVCPATWDPAQHDRDTDLHGDACDLDDGVIELVFASRTNPTWQQESGFDSWNFYRGDLAVLREQGLYTQAPGSNPLATRSCGMLATSLIEQVMPASGAAAFYLVAGVAGGVEGELGSDGQGAPRPNQNPCP